MEFPGLGDHCSVATCNLLDFLPMRCDACNAVLCRDHITYDAHSCASGKRKNVQVPVCPLCNQPVPSKRGEAPDIAVGDHIDRDCQSDPAKAKRQIYTNQCTYGKCKKRELVPIQCSSCRRNFCLKHRHAVDHDCGGFDNSGRSVSSAGSAAVSRAQAATKSSGMSPKQTAQKPAQQQQATGLRNGYTPATVAQLQGDNMTEAAAMALAMKLSLTQNGDTGAANADRSDASASKNQQEEEDLALARALAESEHEFASQQARGHSQRKSEKCVVS